MERLDPSVSYSDDKKKEHWNDRRRRHWNDIIRALA